MARRERDEKVLRIELAAHAEAAADVVLDHVDGALGKPQHGREHAAVEEQRPWWRRKRRASAFAASHSAMQPARLHRHRGQALAAEALAADVLAPWRKPRRHRPRDRSSAARGCCRSLRTAATCRLPPRGGPRPRGSGSMSTSIASSASSASACAVGHHDRDRLADVAHLVVGDHRLLERLELRQGSQPQRNQRNDRRRCRPR